MSSSISTQHGTPVSDSDFGSASIEKNPPHVPLLRLDREGTIQDLTESARRALEYPPDEPVPSCFFSQVHGRNLRRVMWDLARMASLRLRQTRWLIRLRTGTDRWRWYRALVQNHLDQEDGAIHVRLRPA